MNMENLEGIVSRDEITVLIGKRRSFARQVYILELAVLLLFGVAIASTASYDAKVTDVKPAIDGVIEDLWTTGALPSAFIQISPAIGKPASIPTEVFFLYDKDNAYLAARMSQLRSTVQASQVRRDAKQVSQGDYVEFFLDALDNGNSTLVFSFNPTNSVKDGILNTLNVRDDSWDGIFESATSVSDSFWSVEVKLPLSVISFQNQAKQDWKFFVTRYYSQNQETSVIQLVDENQPFRISDFPRLLGLTGLQKEERMRLTPYSYFSRQVDLLADASSTKGKIGGEMSYAPNPAVTLLATVNPDYAQLESDREIINVDDVPTTYPEKRPFFAISSDLYPGLAVNTRNITDIRFGLKARGTTGLTKYDLTTVYADDNVWWWMGDGRVTDNETYYVDLIGGLRRAKDERDYNVTTNLRTWLFDKRLTAYAWFGTINSRRRNRNEWESVNSIQWITRTLNAGFWSHFKTKYYDPSIVGSPTLSNEIIYDEWIDCAWIYESGFWRTIKPSLDLQYQGLFTNPGIGYFTVNAGFEMTIHLADDLGNWTVEGYYRPPITSKFRYRSGVTGSSGSAHEDAYSPFTLVNVKRASVRMEFTSDQSKPVAGTFTFDTKPVRGAMAFILQTEASCRLTSDFSFYYGFEYADVAGSPYQPEFTKTIHRLKFEYGIAERMTLRGVVQLNSTSIPIDDYRITNPTSNLTFSWEYEPGSFIHFVYTQHDVVEHSSAQAQAVGTVYTQSLAAKVSKTFGL